MKLFYGAIHEIYEWFNYLFYFSVSSSSLEDGSPEQTVPKGSTSSDIRLRYHHPPNLYTFMPLGHDSRDSRDSQDMQTTDSETSDITESTDISDPNISLSASPGSSGFQPIKHTQVWQQTSVSIATVSMDTETSCGLIL